MQRSRHSSGGRVLSQIDCGMPVSSRHEPAACTVDDVLQLLRILFALASDVSGNISIDGKILGWLTLPYGHVTHGQLSSVSAFRF